jgi:hypothetical protein
MMSRACAGLCYDVFGWLDGYSRRFTLSLDASGASYVMLLYCRVFRWEALPSFYVFGIGILIWPRKRLSRIGKVPALSLGERLRPSFSF